MRSLVVRCYSQSTSLCPGSKQELRVAPSSRAPLGPAGTTIWRPQSLSRERGKMAQRCVCAFVCESTMSQGLNNYSLQINCKVSALVKNSVLALWPPARFSSRVFRTSTERWTRMWLPCSCCHRTCGWRPLQSCCRMKAKQRMMMLKKRRRTERWIWVFGFWLDLLCLCSQLEEGVWCFPSYSRNEIQQAVYCCRWTVSGCCDTQKQSLYFTLQWNESPPFGLCSYSILLTSVFLCLSSWRYWQLKQPASPQGW